VCHAQCCDATPYAKAGEIVARIPYGEVNSYDITHFEPHLELNFEQIVTAQIDLRNRHVGGSL
jgi:hypothetical protein